MNKKYLTAAAVVLTAALSAGAMDYTSWEASAAAAGELVRDVDVDGRPLVAEIDMYDTGARIIHRENARITDPVRLSEQEWRRMFSREEYQIIRQAGTERPFTSELNDVKEKGVFYSRATGQPLFSSEDKYDSGTGWPSFTRPISPDALVYLNDSSFFARRVEVVDSLSGAHLGHVFSDGPAPTGQRYCINGAALIFVPEGEEPPPLLLPGG